MHPLPAAATVVLKEAIEAASRFRDRTELVVVCNQKSRPPAGDYPRHSLTTEFYSDAELSEVLGSIRAHRLSVRAVVDETEFLDAYASLCSPARPGSTVVVVNFASSRHGPWGKSLLPAVADYAGAITTSSDPYATALVRHKFHGSAVVAQLGLNAPRCWCFDNVKGWYGSQEPPLGTTVFIQPAFESASIGIDAGSRLVVDESLRSRMLRLCSDFQQCAIARDFIEGREIEVPVITVERAIALEPIGISLAGEEVLGSQFLTYDNVYGDSYGFYQARSRIGDALADRLREEARRISEGFGLRGFSRIDFRIDPAGTPYAFDIAANPHFVRHSSFANASAIAGLEPSLLPVALIGLALMRQPSDQF